MNERSAHAKYGNIAYSERGNKVLGELRSELLNHPSDDEVCKIVDELYGDGFKDGQDCTFHELTDISDYMN